MRFVNISYIEFVCASRLVFACARLFAGNDCGWGNKRKVCAALYGLVVVVVTVVDYWV